MACFKNQKKPWLADIMVTHERHQDYKTDPNKFKDNAYHTWVHVAHDCDERFIDSWGKEHGIICVSEKQRASEYLNTRLGGGLGAAFITCFYGQTLDGSKWGHAVAFWSDGLNPQFFDANTGIWEFANGEEPGVAIDEYIVRYYVSGSRSINDQWVYEVLA